ncbi:DNA polymerase processivity subunit [Common bottlenose dolphin gammaherpesvirus 1 strain Sarasota]|uniref:DNA polymerase processivity subunit n=1 Tax=Common bottlenose dolphin gammaherpesvirus 1 strain Sarasota TaxID=2022783 RepID=A0A1Z1NE91_9GAMA|nr:DNA polymerase processivity subunit [Common bottlenose dolphin gammaherpesvirus 1 strain Sarasota]ARW78121.1 DNA polymerase processivity subunit [Common bottlenose dolphin gammaherpesvirus 1 strain Sarasota]
MEYTTVAKLSVEDFSQAVKVHEHLKTHLKRGMVQLSSGPGESPFLNFITGVGNAGILNMKMPAVVSDVCVHPGDNPLSLSFRNMSFGNTFIFSREMFGQNIAAISLKFYKRVEGTHTEFVETVINYTNNATCTHHRSLVEPCVPPVNQQLLESGTLGKVLLSNKSLALVTKWLRGLRSKEEKVVQVSINAALSVIIFTVGDECKTIHVKESGENPSAAFHKVDKPADLVALSADVTTLVNLESLLTALVACKIPGVCTPVIACYDNSILEVIGVPFNNSKISSVAVSTILLKVDSHSQVIHGGEDEQSVTDGSAEDRETEAACRALCDSEEESERQQNLVCSPISDFGDLDSPAAVEDNESIERQGASVLPGTSGGKQEDPRLDVKKTAYAREESVGRSCEDVDYHYSRHHYPKHRGSGSSHGESRSHKRKRGDREDPHKSKRPRAAFNPII